MSFNNLRTGQELRCYTKIIDCYLENSNDIHRKELCKNTSIIKLINKSECRNSDVFIKNALLLVLSLFGDRPADFYDSFGTDIESCSDKDKESLLAELKKEII